MLIGLEANWEWFIGKLTLVQVFRRSICVVLLNVRSAYLSYTLAYSYSRLGSIWLPSTNYIQLGMLIFDNFISRYENFYSQDSTRTRWPALIMVCALIHAEETMPAAVLCERPRQNIDGVSLQACPWRCEHQRCADPKILSPHQSVDFDQGSAFASQQKRNIGSAVSLHPHWIGIVVLYPVVSNWWNNGSKGQRASAFCLSGQKLNMFFQLC